FVLMNEYGFSRLGPDDDFEHQRFSLATAVGLYFPLLKAYFGDAGRCQWFDPASDERGICSRLAGHKGAAETAVCFNEKFSMTAHEQRQAPIQKARAAVKVGRFVAAAELYRQAIRLQPANWTLMCEVSQFLTLTYGEPREAVNVARDGLAL